MGGGRAVVKRRRSADPGAAADAGSTPDAGTTPDTGPAPDSSAAADAGSTSTVHCDLLGVPSLEGYRLGAGNALTRHGLKVGMTTAGKS